MIVTLGHPAEDIVQQLDKFPEADDKVDTPWPHGVHSKLSSDEPWSLDWNDEAANPQVR